jgi:hypothetical protein
VNNERVDADVIVIGAGIAGLMAARVLESRELQVVVFDKGRSVGGRLASRRIGPGTADHGAQFFTAHTDTFQQQVDEWVAAGVVFEWARGWSDGSLQQPSEDGHSRYAAHGGMNALAKYLARDLADVRLNVPIVTATRDENGWVLQAENGDVFTCNALVMTPPVPQSLDILDQGATILRPGELDDLKKIEYVPSLTGMFWIDGRVMLPQPGAVQRPNAPVRWIADNQVKGISPDATLVTVQASDQYSVQMWNAPDERILNALRTDMQMYLGNEATVREAQLKRWRYAAPTTTYPGRYLLTEDMPLLALAGDAFGGPAVEGAVLSGQAAGEAIADVMGK